MDSKYFDPGVLRQFAADFGILGAMVRISRFENESVFLLEALEMAFRSKNKDLLIKIAERLANLSLEVGSTRLHELAQQILADIQGQGWFNAPAIAEAIQTCTEVLVVTRREILEFRKRL